MTYQESVKEMLRKI